MLRAVSSRPCASPAPQNKPDAFISDYCKSFPSIKHHFAQDGVNLVRLNEDLKIINACENLDTYSWNAHTALNTRQKPMLNLAPF